MKQGIKRQRTLNLDDGTMNDIRAMADELKISMSAMLRIIVRQAADQRQQRSEPIAGSKYK
jgi:hypothetical protein